MTTPSIYLRRRHDLHIKFQTAPDPLLAGTKSACALYLGGPRDPPRQARQEGDAAARLDDLEQQLMQLRDCVVKARMSTAGFEFLAERSGQQSWQTDGGRFSTLTVPAADDAEEHSTPASNVAVVPDSSAGGSNGGDGDVGEGVGDEGNGPAGRGGSGGGTNGGGQKKRRKRAANGTAAATSLSEAAAAVSAAATSVVGAVQRLLGVLLRFHLDTLDKSGGGKRGGPLSRIVTEETGLSTIFAHSNCCCATHAAQGMVCEECTEKGGTAFIAEGINGKYPRTSKQAMRANAFARLPAPRNKGAKRFFAGPGCDGGGSYIRGYLGAGGVFHGAEQLTISSRRWIGYCGEEVHRASQVQKWLDLNRPGEDGRWNHTARQKARDAKRMRTPPPSTNTKAAKEKKQVDLDAAKMPLVVAEVRCEHARAALLGILLRMLRWSSYPEAFRYFLKLTNCAFAPATTPFIERRFTASDTAMKELAKRIDRATQNDPEPVRKDKIDVAMWRICNLLPRVGADAHQYLLERLANDEHIGLLLELQDDVLAERGLIGTHCGKVIALVSEAWHWRQQQQRPDDGKNSEGDWEAHFWRNKRFGNGIIPNVDEPPFESDGVTYPELHDTWQPFQELVMSVMRIPASQVRRVMASDNPTWMQWTTNHLKNVGHVWSTVSSRERWWYTAFLRLDICQQPSAVDKPQHIGAGAETGLYWHASRALGKEVFDRGKGNTIRQDQMRAVLQQVRDDRDAYDESFEKALAWLDALIEAAPPEERDQARRTMIEYEALLDEIRRAGPPSSSQSENGECDGAKGREAQEGEHPRKQYFAAHPHGARQIVGELPRPVRVLLTRTVVEAGSVKVRRKWVWLPNGSAADEGSLAPAEDDEAIDAEMSDDTQPPSDEADDGGAGCDHAAAPSNKRKQR